MKFFRKLAVLVLGMAWLPVACLILLACLLVDAWNSYWFYED